MIPIKLTLENFISHTKSEIDFTKFNVALVVGALDNNPNISNGSGKTSIFDAIRFALYHKTRFNSKEKVVKRGKFKATVEFVFSVNDEIYKVIRTYNIKTGSMDVNFYKKVDNRWNPENSDTPTLTTQKIIDVIGMSHDTFVSSVYFRQNDIAGFAGAKPTDRKGVLKEVLRIGIWDKYHKISNEKEKDLNRKLEQVEQRISDMGKIEEEKVNNEQEIANVQVKLAEMKSKVEVLESEAKVLNDKIVDTELLLAKNGNTSRKDQEKRLQEISKRAKEIKDSKEKIKDNVKKNNDIIAKAATDCNELESKLKEYAKDIIIVDHKHRDKALSIYGGNLNILYSYSDLQNKKTEKESLQREMNNYELDLSHITLLEPGKECPVCLSAIDNLSEVCEKRNNRILNLKKQIAIKKKEIASISSEILQIEKAIKKADDSAVEVERTELIISKKISIQSEAERNNEKDISLNNLLGEEWNSLKAEKELIVSVMEGNDDSQKDVVNSLTVEKKEKDKELKISRDAMLSLSVEQGRLKHKAETIGRQISERAALVVQKDQIAFEAEVYSKLTKSFGKDGIPSIIMENITEDLKNFTNTVLETICNEKMSVDFITQTKKSDGEWKEDFEISITMDGSVSEFEDLSGGEQVRVAMAIRLAISQLLMHRAGSDIRFLLLDEVDQALDHQGIEALSDAIQALSKDFKILVVTHNESIKEKFNHVITVVKQPSGSIIQQ